MLFKSFAHWLLLLFVAIALTALVIFGMWFGWWGTDTQSWLHAHVEPWILFYKANEPAVLFATRFVGATGTVLMGAYGLHKAWYYAEWKLPERLVNYIESKANEKLIDDRNALLAAVEIMRLPSNAASTGWLERWRNRRKMKRFEDYTKSLTDFVPELENTLKTLSIAKTSWEKQKATVHIVRGIQAADVALQLTEKSGASQLPIRNHRYAALKEFECAASLDKSDIRALKYAAQQAEELHEYPKAIEHWATLADAFEENRDPLNRARALFAQAKNFEARSRDPSILRRECSEFLGEARDLLEGARKIIGALPSSDERHFALARTCELLGKIRIGLRRHRTALQALSEARAAYEALQSYDEIIRIDELLKLVDERDRAQNEDVSAEEAEAANPDLVLAIAFETLAKAHIRRAEYEAAQQALLRAQKLFRELSPPNEEGAKRIDALLADIKGSTGS